MENKEEKYIEEFNRTEDTLFTIYLRKEGSLLRAREFSCFLVDRFVSGLKQQDKCKLMKSKNDFFVGFPLSSVSKYLPGTQVVNIDNDGKLFKVNIQRNQINWDSNITIDNYLTILDDFKNKVKITEQKISLKSDIEKMILEYPIESKSPIDSYNFIRELKNAIIEKTFNNKKVSL